MPDKTKKIRFLFGWCEREEHDKCKGEKKLPADKKVKSSKAFHYICTCKHHKNGKGPDLVEA